VNTGGSPSVVCGLDDGNRNSVAQELEAQRLSRASRTVGGSDDTASTLHPMRLFRRHLLLQKIARNGRRFITPRQFSRQTTPNRKKSDY
jgi:hypothetical protein